MAPSRRDLPALVFAMAFPSLLTWLYLVVFGSTGEASAEASPAVQIVFALGKIIQFGFPAAYVCCFERERLRPAMPTLRGLGWGLAFGLLVGTTMLGLFFAGLGNTSAFADTPGKVHRLLLDAGCATPGRYLLLAAGYAVGHSLLEEYYWRWFVFGWLHRYTPLSVAIALSALGFMAHHVVLLTVYFPGRFWTLALPLSLGVAVGGAVWAVIYHRSGSLYAAWLSGLGDAVAVLAGHVMESIVVVIVVVFFPVGLGLRMIPRAVPWVGLLQAGFFQQAHAHDVLFLILHQLFHPAHAIRGNVLDLEVPFAEADRVLGGKDLLAGGRQPLAVDLQAVLAVEVADPPEAVLEVQLAVAARDVRERQTDVARLATAHHKR
jgi:membrane protease YdiL (CAAX protease family)